MTRQELKEYPGFAKWAEEGESKGFFKALAECADTEIGETGLPDTSPEAMQHNYGRQVAVRQLRSLLNDPLTRRIPTAPLPRPSYGVKPPTDAT